MENNKKVTLFVGFGFLCVVAIAVFFGIKSEREEKNAPIEQLNTYTTQVNDAIKAEDFGTAYDIIDEMILKGDGNHYGQSDLEKAADKLNTKAVNAEFTYLLGQDIPVATKATKIILTVKERAKANVWRYEASSNYSVGQALKIQQGLYKDFITTAKSCGQDELADKLQEALDAIEQQLADN